MTFTVIAIYHILKYLNKKTLIELFYVCLFVLSTCLFRFAVGAQLIIALIICITIRRVGRSWISVVVIFLLASLFVIVNLDQIIITLGGNGLDDMLKAGELGTSNLSIEQRYLLNFIYSIIGSPSHISGEIGFNHITSFSDLVRTLISIYMFAGIVLSLKRKDIHTLGLFLFWILGAGMLALVLRGSDFRFAAVYFPSVLLLAGVGYENKIRSKWFKPFSIFTISIVLALTFIWNR